MDYIIKEKNLTTCVVKIASLCNLNCTYCYMYNKGDDSYKKQPKLLSRETIVAFFKKMENYLSEDYKFHDFTYVFHGGEPLLASKELYTFFIDTAEELSKKLNIRFSYGIQTNGVLIDDDWAKFLVEKNISVGISLDSTVESNNKNRIFHNGKSSYDQILEGFNTLKKYTSYTPGILSVLDITADPDEVFEHYKQIGAERINLLYPDDTYEDGFVDDLTLGKWLERFYNLWLEDKTIIVDQFEVLLTLLYGGDFAGSEYYGNLMNNTFILESNGELQANDPLRICLPGLNHMKINVHDHEIHDLMNAKSAQFYFNSNSIHRCDKCNDCQLSELCAGGYFINRFSKANGFDNPSIFCKSLGYFITKVQNSVVDHVEKVSGKKAGIERIDLDEMLTYCETPVTSTNEFLTSFNSKQAG